jgi:hypothetical protein
MEANEQVHQATVAPRHAASAAVAMLCKRGFKLIMIEPEGTQSVFVPHRFVLVLTKISRLSGWNTVVDYRPFGFPGELACVPPSPQILAASRRHAAGTLKKRANVAIDSKANSIKRNDSFIPEMVPFLWELLCSGNSDDLRLCLVTDFAQRAVAESEFKDNIRINEDECAEVREKANQYKTIIDEKLITRLHAEFAAHAKASPTPSTNATLVRIKTYHALLPSNCTLCDDDAAAVREQNGYEWMLTSTKPNPGLLQEALRDHGLEREPSKALMVGFDHRDQKAAARAGVFYIHWQHLIAGHGATSLTRFLIDPSTVGATRGPDSFGSEQMSERR